MVFSIVSVFCCFTINAQDYKTAIGGRLGYPLSASIKHFINESHALEANVGTRGFRSHRWTNISAAYQIHKSFNTNELPDNLKWYYGFGASVYFWSWTNDYSYYRDEYSSSSVGVQGYIGLDYTFDELPLNLTLDWVPSFFVNGFGNGLGAGYGSLGVRYVWK